MAYLAIVDDNDAWCFSMTHFLQQYGHTATSFTDTDRFLREADRFDLALIDFSMPPRRYQKETDGPDIIRKVKEQFPRSPILVLISSYFTPDVLQDIPLICPQADACFCKGTPPQELVQQINRLLQIGPSHVREYSRSFGSIRDARDARVVGN
ncbi:MAG: response regulator [Leptolyngbyaceae cyanobacterium bins.59]|nr:response regulator [Leptolyngbyaceae cyanobacterium bins.59]